MSPWIARDHITNRLKSQAKKATSIPNDIVPCTENNTSVAEKVTLVSQPNAPNSTFISTVSALVVYKQPQGGQPVGSTTKKRKMDEMARVSTIDEITLECEKETKEARNAKTRVNRGQLDTII